MAQRTQALSNALLANKESSITTKHMIGILLDDRKDLENTNRTMTMGTLTVNIRSSFHPEKKLYDALFSIANARLKEKSK